MEPLLEGGLVPGTYPVAGNSHVRGGYTSKRSSERDRHRYEVSIHHKAALEAGVAAIQRHEPGRRPPRDRRAAGPFLVRGGAVPQHALRCAVVRDLYRVAVTQSRLV